MRTAPAGEAKAGVFRERNIRSAPPRVSFDPTREAARVAEAGEELARSLHLRDLETYQELVRAFITAVVAQAFRLRREVGQDRRGRGRIFQIVLKVDEALAELARAVLEGEKARLEILARLDEIRGLLLDLYR